MQRSAALRHALGLVLVAIPFVLYLNAGGDEEAKGDPIHVAFAGPLTGPSAKDGLSGVNAIRLVFEQANEAGGIGGRPLVLDIHDDQNDESRARANAATIADESEAIAVIGHNYSSCSIAAGEVYRERGIVAIATAATSVAVTEDNPWYFRVVFNDRDQGRSVVEYAHHVLGARRVGILHSEDAYGSYLAEVMSAATSAGEPELAGVWGLREGPSLEALLDRMVPRLTGPEAPDALLLAMQPATGVPLVKRLRDHDYRGQIIATDALSSQAFADGFDDLPREQNRRGFYTDGIHASTPFLFDTGGHTADDFTRAYIVHFDRSPDWYAAFAADAAKVLVEAMRRAAISPTPETLREDRAALRETLASFGRDDAVEGVTGLTFFDAVGDAEKPIPMGLFDNGEILSAFTQLLLLPGVERIADLSPALDPERVVVSGDQLLYRTDVARVGVRARRFGKLDARQGTFDMEFDIWFRHGGDHDAEDVVIINALSEIDLGDPTDALDSDGLRYRLYRAKGVLSLDTLAAPYGEHVMAVHIRHRDRIRNDLILAVDAVGMNLGRQRTQAERLARSRRLLGPTSGWTSSAHIVFEDEVDEPTLGNPNFLEGAKPARRFSELTIGLRVKRNDLSLSGWISGRYRTTILWLALTGSIVLIFWGRGLHPALRWLLQAGMAFLLLVTAEPLIGTWFRNNRGFYNLDQLSRGFDVLWWLLVAILINVAIDRFLWRPASARSGHSVPSVLRYVVSSLVYLLAFFGVVAFVYDYTLTGLLATSGVLAMIFGLAVQINITNLFAGVAINLERPFRVGDWIMIHGRTPNAKDGVTGMVTDINWRTTRLRTTSDTEIVIPNGVISEKTITNFMAPKEMSRFQLSYFVDPGEPEERVLASIQQGVDAVLGSENKGPLREPRPSIRINRVSELGVEYMVRYRIIPREVSPAKARHTINRSVLRHLRDAGIQLAQIRREDTQAPASGGGGEETSSLDDSGPGGAS